MRISDVQELRDQSQTEKQTKLFTILGLDKEFMTGGNIQMYPQNTDNAISALCQLLNISSAHLDRVIKITQLDDNFLQYPRYLTIRFLLRHILDLSGSVKYRLEKFF